MKSVHGALLYTGLGFAVGDRRTIRMNGERTIDDCDTLHPQQQGGEQCSVLMSTAVSMVRVWKTRDEG